MLDVTRDVEAILNTILREIISDAGLPPQIVDIPEEGFIHSPVTCVLNAKTIKLLDGIAEQYGTSREAAARSILHAFATIVDRRMH